MLNPQEEPFNSIPLNYCASLFIRFTIIIILNLNSEKQISKEPVCKSDQSLFCPTSGDSFGFLEMAPVSSASSRNSHVFVKADITLDIIRTISSSFASIEVAFSGLSPVCCHILRVNVFLTIPLLLLPL